MIYPKKLTNYNINRTDPNQRGPFRVSLIPGKNRVFTYL